MRVKSYLITVITSRGTCLNTNINYITLKYLDSDYVEGQVCIESHVYVNKKIDVSSNKMFIEMNSEFLF